MPFLILLELFMAFFQMMKTNLRGELTLYNDDKMHQFSLRDNELIDAVASHFKVGSTEVKIILRTLANSKNEFLLLILIHFF